MTLPLLFPQSDQWAEPYPTWVDRFRPWQWTAAHQIVEAFNRVDVVVLDAPTGSGKTLIAEMVARLLEAKRLYVCSDKGLQDQFTRDYPASRVLKGRSNYDTLDGGDEVTAADCDRDQDFCSWCTVTSRCPYQIAKREARTADCAVLNTSYLLAECNGPGEFRDRALCVVDEADTLEQQLMGYVTFELTERMAERLGVVDSVPVKGSHMPTIATWIRDMLRPAVNKARGEYTVKSVTVQNIRTLKALDALGERARLVGGMLEADASMWVRDNGNDHKPLVLRPIVVDQLAEGALWKHAHRWLLMSATVVSADEMMGSLGKARGEFEVVTCPMTFPVENRRVIVAPVADMTKKARQWDAAAKAVTNICTRHSSERVLIHSVSYGLTRHIADALRAGSDRPVFTHDTAAGKSLAVERYRARERAVLISPSLERGIDLHGDNCRVIIICKVPFPYLGDAQVAARMHRGREGQMWYTVQAIRSLVQMTGRGVRSADDWAMSYVLDVQFVQNVWRKSRHLLPRWWVEALDMNNDVRWLLA